MKGAILYNIVIFLWIMVIANNPIHVSQDVKMRVFCIGVAVISLLAVMLTNLEALAKVYKKFISKFLKTEE